MNPSLQQLADTLLWSETDNSDERGGEPLDKNYSILDFDQESLDKLYQKFSSFTEEAERLLTEDHGDDWSSIDDFYIGRCNKDYMTEHHYIMTANGHGVGFWDESDWSPEAGSVLTKLAEKDGEIDVIVGDDKKLYIHFG